MKKLFIIPAIFFIAALSVLLFPTSVYKNQDRKIEVGKTYLFSNKWDNENPFLNKEIDTVKVSKISTNHVQWVRKNGFVLTGELRYFKHCVKPL
jgi:uncharacterized protein YxeA